MNVEVRFFARCREIVGEKRTEVEIADGMMLKDVIDFLLNAYPDLKNLKVLVSLNHAYAESGTILKDGDEIAVFPPVSGG